MARRTHIGRLATLLGSTPTLADLWDHLARAYGDRPFLTVEEPLGLAVAEGSAFTTSGVRDVVAKLAGGLHALGVGRNTRVALCTDNRIDYAFTAFAIMRLGAVAIPLHHHLKPGELAAYVNRARADIVIVDPGIETELRGVQVIAAGPGGALDQASSTAISAEPAQLDPDQTACIMYTSGTTGEPKGAELTSRSLLSIARLAAMVPDGKRETGVLGLPLAHVAGLSALLGLAFAGVQVHWLRKFRGEVALDAIEQRGATFFLGVPAMYSMLLAAGAERRDLSSIKMWISAADAMPPHLVDRFRSLGCLVRTPRGEPVFTAAFAEIYGMVELSGPAIVRLAPSLPAENRYNTRLRSAGTRVKELAKGLISRHAILERITDPLLNAYGIPIPPYKVKVVDDDGNEVSSGVVGELVLKGPGVSKGYDADPEASSRTTRDGWLYTGDLASRSRLGRISFVSRKKDVIKHGGFSVFPAEVEAELVNHPDVREAVVFAAPHDVKGQIPAAAVIAKEGAQIDAAQFAQWCRDNLAAYRCPRAIVVMAAEAIPRNANRKVLKADLCEQVLPQLQQAFPSAFE